MARGITEMSKPKKNIKLSLEDVISIKRHLLFKDLSGKEIALKFGISTSLVSSIKKGASYPKVQLDENGDYIDLKMDDEKFREILKNHENRVKGEELTKLGVADIKYILQKEYLSNSEIADMFKIGSRTVRDIGNGITFTDVKIDKNGNYITPTLFRKEPLPEYIVPRIERVEKIVEVEEVELSEEEQEILDIKILFLERLWSLKPIWIRDGSGKYLSTRVESTNIYFNSWIHNHWSKKYRTWGKMSMQDFIAYCGLIVQEAVMRFKPTQSNYKWQGMHILNKDEDGNEIDDGIVPNISSLNIIFDYLKKAIGIEMKEYDQLMQGVKKFGQKIKVDGKEERFYDYVGIGNNSTDAIISGDDSEITSVINLLDNDSSFYGSNYGKIENEEVKSLSHFSEFFEKWKRYVLTEEEYHFYEIINATQHKRGGGNYTVNDRHLYGLDKNKAKNIRRSIKAKAIEAYKEMYPKLFTKEVVDEEIETKSRIEIKNINDMQVLERFLAIIDDEEIELEDVNREMSEYILSRLDSPFMFNFIYDSEALRGTHTFNIIDGLKTGIIASVTLYKLVEVAEDKLKIMRKLKTEINNIRRGEVVDFDKHKKRKRHTSLRLSTFGTSFELDGNK